MRLSHDELSRNDRILRIRVARRRAHPPGKLLHEMLHQEEYPPAVPAAAGLEWETHSNDRRDRSGTFVHRPSWPDVGLQLRSAGRLTLVCVCFPIAQTLGR